jgi:antitoxin ParD1/3/4
MTKVYVERWLRDEVAPVYDAIQADPERVIPAKAVFDAIRTHHAEQIKTARS